MAEKNKPMESRKDGETGKEKPNNIETRIKLLEENEKKLRQDSITLENHRKTTEQNLLATLGGLSELRRLVPNPDPIPEQKK